MHVQSNKKVRKSWSRFPDKPFVSVIHFIYWMYYFWVLWTWLVPRFFRWLKFWVSQLLPSSSTDSRLSSKRLYHCKSLVHSYHFCNIPTTLQRFISFFTQNLTQILRSNAAVNCDNRQGQVKQHVNKKVYRSDKWIAKK